MTPNRSHHLTLAQAVHRGPCMSSFHFAPAGIAGASPDVFAEQQRFDALKLLPDPKATPTPETFPLTITNRALLAEDINRFAMCGRVGNAARRFATITTGVVGGGITMPALGVAPLLGSNAVTNSFRLALELLGVEPIKTPDTTQVNWPILDPTGGDVVEENATEDDENGTLGGVKIVTKTYASGSAWFSDQALHAGLDVVNGLLPDMVAIKEKALEMHITETLIDDAGITQQVTAASTSTLTAANLLSLRAALPRRFRGLRVIMLGATAYSAAEALVGSDGHYILNPHGTIDGVSYFKGTLVVENDNFESFGASKVIGCVLSLMGFRLRDSTIQELARMQVPSRPAQTGLRLFGYHGFGWLPEAVAKLVTPAS